MNRLGTDNPWVPFSVLENVVDFIYCIYELEVSVGKAETRLYVFLYNK